MVAFRRRLAHLSRGRLPVLLLAELGSEKESVARTLHALSAHRSGPFVTYSCAASEHRSRPESLFDLRAGALASARGGLLMLDEIGKLGGGEQRQLLRCLKSGELRSKGEAIPLDLRMVCTSSTDLYRSVESGAFLS